MSAAQRATTAIAEWMRYRSWDVVRHRDHIAAIIEQEYAGVVEALERLVAIPQADCSFSCNGECAYCQARAAIAKARGEA